MLRPLIKHGPLGNFRRSEHFVMSERDALDGATVYGVWVVTARNTAEKVAEFRSRLEARRWCSKRNADTAGTRAMR